MKRKSQSTLENIYSSRRKHIIKQITSQAAIFFSSPTSFFGRDQNHSFRQNSDFLYLTGINAPKCALLLLGSKTGARSILFVEERNSEKERWTGKMLGVKKARGKFQVDEVMDFKEIRAKLPELVMGCSILHYSPGLNEFADNLVFSLFKTTRGPSPERPQILSDARLITAPMRIIKDRYEISCIKHVTNVTAKGFVNFAKQVRSLKSEIHAAHVLETEFAKLGAHGLGFSTIVASGKNATVLHHEPQLQAVWKRELLLVDAGALFNGYSGDITRTLPASGRFSDAQAEVYDIVHQALTDTILRAAPGASLNALYNIAAATITKGLIKIGVLRGNVNSLVSKGAYKPYFMHRIGHFLGLDVHDQPTIYYKGQLQDCNERPFEVGMVFTVEPGLYFEVNDSTVPKQYRGIGIRIEEDVLITQRGCEVLTEDMPSRRKDIESLILGV